MAKAKATKKRASIKKKTSKNNSIVRNALAGLDKAALEYRNLLVDPCNAPFARPTYGGLGTGFYRRVRRIINIPSTAVEGCWVFSPGNNTYWYAHHSSGNAGTNYTFVSDFVFTSISGLGNAEGRCLAACVKARYVGPELSRAGVIGLYSGPCPRHLVSAASSAAVDVAASPFVARLGEVQHEVKFVPAAGDELFSNVTSLAVGADSAEMSKSVLAVAFQGVPSGTLQLEITAVMELEATSDGVLNTIVPSSRFTTNHVLQSLGDAASWAYHRVISPVIKSTMDNVVATGLNTTNAASIGMRMLTL